MSPYHRRAAVVSTGDEIVLGESLDTNSKWLAERLMGMGIETAEHVTVGDDRAGTVAALRRLVELVPLVITTGGLGPTADDVMRDALAEVMGEELVIDERAMARLEARFAARGIEVRAARTSMAPGGNQRAQAMRPASAACIDNENGTAPGLHGVVRTSAGHGEADVFCLPGPPGELVPMFERWVVARLRPDPALVVRTRLLHTVGIGEGDAAARLGEVLERGRNPLVGITAAGAVVTLRIRCAGTEGAGADAAVTGVERVIRERLGVHVFGSGEDTLAGVVVRRLTETGRAVSVVESCTGGMLGEEITHVAGSSEVFRGGWITYSNEMKAGCVGVPTEMIARHGAVSGEVARAMAVGGLRAAWHSGDGSGTSAPGSGGRHCLAITGIAGPEGGSAAKPVGTVYIAHAWTGGVGAGGYAVRDEVRRFLISGGRDDVRLRATRSALAMLYFALRDAGEAVGPLLWEVGPGPMGRVG